MNDTQASKYASLLNALVDMQDTLLYAARKPILQAAEGTIAALEAEVDRLHTMLDDVIPVANKVTELLKKQNEQTQALALAETALKTTVIKLGSDGSSHWKEVDTALKAIRHLTAT